MKKTQLDACKEEWGCENDGTAVIIAAQRGYFEDESDKPSYSNAITPDVLLVEIGISIQTDRARINACLRAQIHTYGGKKEELINQEYKKMTEGTIVLPGVKKARKLQIEGRINRIIYKVAQFCNKAYEKQHEEQ